eukprot:TRINITY_DN2363_c0_g1_i5.p1 TRINITY_DN2363_c0_g1~~TRINITY_DN2363_c0_g1_i5.p1  ORF type:complete len:699 (+),score=130.27 TRINITY_DN2363_c0_g1_i5:28-2097(+)
MSSPSDEDSSTRTRSNPIQIRNKRKTIKRQHSAVSIQKKNVSGNDSDKSDDFDFSSIIVPNRESLFSSSIDHAVGDVLERKSAHFASTTQKGKMRRGRSSFLFSGEKTTKRSRSHSKTKISPALNSLRKGVNIVPNQVSDDLVLFVQTAKKVIQSIHALNKLLAEIYEKEDSLEEDFWASMESIFDKLRDYDVDIVLHKTEIVKQTRLLQLECKLSSIMSHAVKGYLNSEFKQSHLLEELNLLLRERILYLFKEKRKQRLLFLNIAAAKGIMYHEILISSPNSFTQIFVDELLSGRTRTIAKSIAPDWVEDFEIPIYPENREVIFRVMHDGDSEHFLGEACIDLNDFEDSILYEEWLPLMSKGRGKVISNQLKVKISYDLNPGEGLKLHIIGFDRPIKAKSKALVSIYDVESDFKETHSTKYSKDGTWDEYIHCPYHPLNDTLRVRIKIKTKGTRSGTYAETIFSPINYINEEKNFKSTYLNLKKEIRKVTKYGSIRVLWRCETLKIRGMDFYNDLFDTLLDQNLLRIIYHISANAEERKDIFKSIIGVLEYSDSAVKLIKDLVSQEIERTEDETLLFRANSWAAIIIDCYMKRIGQDLLESVLEKPLLDIYRVSKDNSFELQQDKILVGNQTKNWSILRVYLVRIWESIIEFQEDVPLQLRQIFKFIRDECTKKWPEEDDIEFLTLED